MIKEPMYILSLDFFPWIIQVPSREQNSHGLFKWRHFNDGGLLTEMRVELRDAAPRDYQQPEVVTTLTQWELEPSKRDQAAWSLIEETCSYREVVPSREGRRKKYLLLSPPISCRCIPMAEPNWKLASKEPGDAVHGEGQRLDLQWITSTALNTSCRKCEKILKTTPGGIFAPNAIVWNASCYVVPAGFAKPK